MTRALSKKLITEAVAAGTAGKTYVMLWDSSPKGLGLRIRRGGGSSWLFRYRTKDAARTAPVKSLTLGNWPELSVESARALALGHAAKIAAGGDPGADLRQRKLRERSTVGPALNDYENSLERRHIVNRKLVMSILRKGFEPVISSEIETLGLRTIVGLIDRIATTRHKRKDGTVYTTPGTAAEFKKLASGFLGWAALQGMAPGNVLGGYRAQKQSREQKLAKSARQGRALTDSEIVAVWNAASSMRSFGALVQAGLLTGMRRNELAGLRWTDITDDVITITEDKTKQGREHKVPLSSVMKEVLAAQQARSTGRLVFPSDITGSAMSGWSKMLPRLVKVSGVPFRLHDLRRTTRTMMSRLGVSEAVAEAAIGHAKTGLVAIYDKHDHLEERRAAFEAVGQHIASLIGGDGGDSTASNVVVLRRG